MLFNFQLSYLRVPGKWSLISCVTVRSYFYIVLHTWLRKHREIQLTMLFWLSVAWINMLILSSSAFRSSLQSLLKMSSKLSVICSSAHHKIFAKQFSLKINLISMRGLRFFSEKRNVEQCIYGTYFWMLKSKTHRRKSSTEDAYLLVQINNFARP